MKKIWVVLFITYLIFPKLVMAEEERVKGEYGTYDNAVKIIQEVMRDYYIKEDKFQYNYSRASYGENAPEDATIQDTKHLVCASYTYSCYSEAFGVSSSDGFPIYNYSITNSAADYYNTNKDDASKMDGHLLIYYEKKAANQRYIYNKTGDVTVSEFAQIIQPGDLFAYSGHAMIAYAVVERTPGNWDVLMLNSATKYTVKSRIDGTSKIFYDMFPSQYSNTEDVIKVDQEGTIKNFWLSGNSKFVKNGKINCQKEECSVIRQFYKGDDGKAYFNYSILPSKYDKSILRTNYPGLYIEKTVNKIDNNSVYLNDELEYTIKITNKSNSTGTGSNYDKFYIVENIGENVIFVSSPTGEKNNETVVFTINQLEVGETVMLTYKVKVKDDLDNIGKKVQATGKLVSDLDSEVFISTGLVENTIIPTTKSIKKSYNDCYNENKTSKEGLALVNEVYKCAYGEDFHFEEFSFESIFSKKKITGKGASNAIKFKKELDSNAQLYKKMILNNLWNGIVEYDNGTDDGDTNSGDDEISIYTLPRWSGDTAKTRARNIHPQFFKEGDVLIYTVDYSNTTDTLKNTRENGLYAYIYLDGKFVGINGLEEDITSSQNIKNTIRNSFTPDYYEINGLDLNYGTNLYAGYSRISGLSDEESILEKANYLTLFDKDYYVILRPEMVIKEIAKIEVTKEPSKATYNSTQKKLVMEGGELTYTYNDGSKGIITLEDDDIDVTGYDDTITGNQNITISYCGQETQLLIKVDSDSQWQDVIPYTIHNFTVDETNKYISKIMVNTEVNNFTSNIILGYGYGIDVDTKTINNKQILFTGGKTRITHGLGVYREYTNIVIGDINGDGAINSADLLKIRQHLLGTNILTGAYFLSSDINYDSTINSADLLRVRQHLLGSKPIA